MTKKKTAKPAKAKAKPVKKQKPVKKTSPVNKRAKKVAKAVASWSGILDKVEKTVRGEHEQAARFEGINIIEGEAVVLSDDEVKAELEKKAETQLRLQQEAFAQDWLNAHLKKLGLVEIPVKGTDLTLLGPPDFNKAPLTMEQRFEMCHRLNSVGPHLPKYVARLVDIQMPGRSTAAILDRATEHEGEDEMNRNVVSPELKEKMEKIGNGALEIMRKSGKVAPPEKQKGKSTTVKVEKVATKTAASPKKKANMTPLKVPAGGFNKSNKPPTSGELIRALIWEHKLEDEQIATLTRKLFEGRNTKSSDVRWNRGQMRLAGIDAPDPVGEETPQKGKGKK